jgi:hypothetical protein
VKSKKYIFDKEFSNAFLVESVGVEWIKLLVETRITEESVENGIK